jgi:hypothetical protein
MKLEHAEKLLEILVENSMQILRFGFGLDNVESTFYEIVDLLRSNPNLKRSFLAMVRITMDSDEPGRLDAGMAPRELIELIAHELKWDEIRFLSQERIRNKFNGDRNIAQGDIAESVIDAFDECWPDREFYKRLQKTAPSS